MIVKSEITRPRYKNFFIGMVVFIVNFGFGFAARTNDSPTNPKPFAIEVVERNADQIATVGDVLYYFAEPGMQEYESSKYLKETLEQIGFKVEVGGAGLPTNVWATWGSGKPVIAIATKWIRCRKVRKHREALRANRWSRAHLATWKGTT